MSDPVTDEPVAACLVEPSVLAESEVMSTVTADTEGIITPISAIERSMDSPSESKVEETDISKNELPRAPETDTAENKIKETVDSSNSAAEANTTASSSKEPSNNAAASTMDPSTLHYEGDTCIYTDPATKYQYEWDKTKSEWVAKASAASYGYEGDTHTYTDPTDGTCYIWDKEKNAWFPKVDDDFLAQYQMSYGFTDPKVEAEREAEAERKKVEKERLEAEAAQKKREPPKDPTWFELEEHVNTKVYVSNLPTDITEQEFVDVMQKCGMVMRDADTNRMKVKLYTEPGDPSRLKGDALCTYIKVESVDLALNLLDGYEMRGKKLSVERAKFQMKGSYDPNLKPKKRRKKDKEKLKKQQEALFDWRPEKMRGERSKHERTVIIKNLFDPKMFEKDVGLILEYQQDMREECAKCGVVKKVVIYDRHADGVAQVTFADPEEADACITLLNGRWFGQRKISAETWDGKTKYKVSETKEEEKARLQKWEKFLEADEKKKEEEKSRNPTDTATMASADATSPAADETTSGEAVEASEMRSPAEVPVGGRGGDCAEPKKGAVESTMEVAEGDGGGGETDSGGDSD